MAAVIWNYQAAGMKPVDLLVDLLLDADIWEKGPDGKARCGPPLVTDPTDDCVDVVVAERVFRICVTEITKGVGQ